MSLTRGLAVGVVFAALAAVGSTSPAQAADFSGTYDLQIGGENVATWVITPCGAESFIPCVHVAQTGGVMQPFDGDANLSVGYWTMVAERADAIGCDDGRQFSAPTTYSWDAVTLAGQISANNGGMCGGTPASLSTPFTLMKASG